MSTALVHLLLIFVFGAAHALPVDQWTSESALVEVTTKVEGTSSSASSLLLADQLLADDASSLMGSQSRQKPADDGGIEFPNTAFIPGDLTEQLSVDGFFSLWFVFLDDDVFTSDKEFTILAPSNSAPMRPSPTADDKDRVRQLLLNHIVLGRAVNISSDLSSSLSPPWYKDNSLNNKKTLTVTTLGGRQLHFKTRKDGTAVVNGIRIVGKEVRVPPNGVIIVLEDYLFMDEYHGDVEGSESQLFSAIPMVTASDGSDHFPMIELGTAHDDESGGHEGETVKHEPVGSVLIDRQKLIPTNVSRPFYEELVEVLNFLRSGTSDFLRYLEQVNISSSFLDDEEYTAFIPMDDSFAQWYPIDWGFNPFDVESFVKETMMNHFVRGRVKQKEIKDGDELTTLGGKTLTFSFSPIGKLIVNDLEVFDGDTPVSMGNIQFVGDLLFVNSTVVRELNARHRDVESAPLVTSPWYSSQFLSHTYRELSTRQQSPSIVSGSGSGSSHPSFSLALDYINQTQPQLRDDLPSHDDWKMITYTFFVPKDSAFFNLWPQDTADPFVIDDEFRRDVFLNHFVRRRLYHDRDLVDGAVITMAGNKTATISRVANVTKINDAIIEEADIFIYNLGTVFVIDRVLFASQERISQVLTKNADRIPSFGLSGTDGAPPSSSSSSSSSSSAMTHNNAAEESQTLVVDLLAELTTTESTAGKLVIRE
ncbi:uncharacterized protein LOC124343179 [Daphnia pulicaria]|uniref:uncharacterized protein LOC124343179 n=1 Tax=Daphnia pulicaria TaxID=35523 RepID=UPI001EECC4EA|nr:uncharacterized protein LOC124343179 [Daphnia pulicaria]